MERPLPALALWRDPADGTGYWRRAVVLQYDSAGEKFEVQYEEILENLCQPGWIRVDLGGWNGLLAAIPSPCLLQILHIVWRCLAQEAEPTELGGRRGMMEFLPRLRVMFRGEDPEVLNAVNS